MTQHVDHPQQQPQTEAGQLATAGPALELAIQIGQHCVGGDGWTYHTAHAARLIDQHTASLQSQLSAALKRLEEAEAERDRVSSDYIALWKAVVKANAISPDHRPLKRALDEVDQWGHERRQHREELRTRARWHSDISSRLSYYMGRCEDITKRAESAERDRDQLREQVEQSREAENRWRDYARTREVLADNLSAEIERVRDQLREQLEAKNVLLAKVREGLDSIRYPVNDGTREWKSDLSTYLRGQAAAILMLEPDDMRAIEAIDPAPAYAGDDAPAPADAVLTHPEGEAGKLVQEMQAIYADADFGMLEDDDTPQPHTREAVEKLIDVATGKVAHDYQGSCPNETDTTRRDPECPACAAIIAADLIAARVQQDQQQEDQITPTLIRKARQRLKWSLAKTATASKLSVPEVSEAERHGSVREHVERVAKALQVAAAEAVGFKIGAYVTHEESKDLSTARWSPPGHRAHVSTARPLPSLFDLYWMLIPMAPACDQQQEGKPEEKTR